MLKSAVETDVSARVQQNNIKHICIAHHFNMVTRTHIPNLQIHSKATCIALSITIINSNITIIMTIISNQ